MESVRVAEQERSLAEARQHLEEWDHLVIDPDFLHDGLAPLYLLCYSLPKLDASTVRLVAALLHAVCALLSPYQNQLPRLDDEWPAQGGLCFLTAILCSRALVGA